jgi:hypothetical protein
MKSLYALLITTALSLSLFAQGLELKPYGFVKGDGVYSSKGVLSFGNANLTAPQLANGVENAALGFTAMHTRFGLKGTFGEEMKVGGLIELDFFNSAGFNTNVNPRIRLAYASLIVDNWEFRFGQQWDLFSPLNPNTQNTNGNMWFAGNLGFRRGQIQIHYKIPLENITPMIQVALAEATSDASGLGNDNKAVMPMFQGRLSAKFLENKVIGVYFVTAKFSPNPDTTDYDFNASGFGADFTLPLHKYFELHGEVNTGTNLYNCNLFTIAGNGSKDIDRKNLGVWGNITSKIDDHFHLIIGGGMDKNQTDDLSAGATAQNFVIYGNFVFPIVSGFSVSLELGNISTTLQGDEEVDEKTNSALYGFLSGKVAF